MTRIGIRELLAGPADPQRILFHNVWFRGHNNPRYEELLPRLPRLDQLLIVCSDRRLVRAAQYRALTSTRSAREAAVLRLGGRRYRWMFTTAPEQIPRFRGRVVADVDDPVFDAREPSMLDRPNVAAVVVTDRRAAARFESLGVRTPFHVIPQGVDLAGLDVDEIARVAAVHRRPGDVVVGYTAAYLLLPGDRGGTNPLYDVGHLLDLWTAIRARVPAARLWLIGEPSARLRRRCAGRDDIVLIGRVQRARLLTHVANFDVALYPRPVDQGIRSVKVAEYLGAGVPTVSYSYDVTSDLAEAGAGILVDTPTQFAAAVSELAENDQLRGRLAERAAAAGRARDWRILAERYRAILDRYLPPGSAGGGPVGAR